MSRYECRSDQEKAKGISDLNAAHRVRFGITYVDDRAKSMGLSISCPVCLTPQPEYVDVRREFHPERRLLLDPIQRHPPLALFRPEAQSGCQLNDCIGKPFIGIRKLTPSVDVYVPV